MNLPGLFRTIAPVALILAFLAGICPAEPASIVPTAHPRDSVRIEGVPNFCKVSDGLYRSAQPTAEGMRNLEAMGIRTIVNLRSFHSDDDKIAGTGLGCESIHAKAWYPQEKQVAQFLKIVTDNKRAPVLVHCQHGADRTGTMCAVYRIAVQGWTKEEALREMTEGGFGFHRIWGNLIEWINRLDIEKIRQRAAIEKSMESVISRKISPLPTVSTALY
jgi:protein tyrosine/serine phosphatase